MAGGTPRGAPYATKVRRLSEIALLGTVFIAACAQNVATPSPSPTATAAPSTASPSPATPSPTATPSPSPTPPPPRTPEPTISYVAGQRLLPFYFQIRPAFALLPPAPVILPDDDSSADENAAFKGLNTQGEPQFAVRHDFLMDMGTTAHEMGHAYEAVLERKDPARDWLAMYWTFRGFPGTWQQAQAQSDAQTSNMGRWIMSPRESWAEAFRAAVTGEVKEKTLDYGRTIDPVATRQFFQSLASK